VSPDKRPAVLAAVLFVVLLIVSSFDPLGYYFGVLTKPWFIIAAIMGAVAVWFFLVRAIWRANLLDRFLGLNRDEWRLRADQREAEDALFAGLDDDQRRQLSAVLVALRDNLASGHEVACAPPETTEDCWRRGWPPSLPSSIVVPRTTMASIE
jgi:hypothetical protein